MQEDSETMYEARQRMINTRFGGNVLGRKSNNTFTHVNKKNDILVKEIPEKSLRADVNDTKYRSNMTSNRKQQEFGAKKRIKP